jgi:HlyD family secretion protein
VANNTNNAKKDGNSKKPFWILGLVVAITCVGFFVVWLKVLRGNEGAEDVLATATVKRGPLKISVLESGTIKAREQIIIKNKVEGRTSIISLVAEGTHVKKGDLLVELDVSDLADEKIEQEISVQNAYSALINAQESLAVVKNQAIADVNVAKLTLLFAGQDLHQYQAGLYLNEKTAAENDITLAQEELTRAERTLEWSDKLYNEKYISETELQADKLAVTRSTNKLVLANSAMDLLVNFSKERTTLQLESDVQQAELALERIERKAKASVLQAEADLRAKELEHRRQTDKFKKLEDQLLYAKVIAPADGMVIYATTASRGSWRRGLDPLDEGVTVYERQELIYLPTADSYMAEVDVHESSLKKVRVGLPVIITVDALQGEKFLARMTRIAPLPDAASMWMNPDLKVYSTDVHLEDNGNGLRTGMSCRAEIVVEQHQNALSIPVQAVLRIGGKAAVFVVKDDELLEQREVEIGLDNHRVVHITSGLKEGETVLLEPPLHYGAIDPLIANSPQITEGTREPRPRTRRGDDPADAQQNQRRTAPEGR